MISSVTVSIGRRVHICRQMVRAMIPAVLSFRGQGSSEIVCRIREFHPREGTLKSKHVFDVP